MASARASLTDRFDTLLAVGRRIASAPSDGVVFAAVRAAAETLLQGNSCRVMEVDGWPATGAAGDSGSTGGKGADRLCQSLLAEALEAGRAVVRIDRATDPLDGEVLLGIRSALCAPIFCDGCAVACLYVTHDQMEDGFGDDEVKLAEFVTTLAGAALEHVAGTEARFRSLTQNSSDVITVVDLDATVVYQSTAMTGIFGFDPSHFVGRPLAEWCHPDDVADMLTSVDAIVRHGEVAKLVESRLLHQDGSWRHVETALKILVQHRGVTGVVLNSRAISDRKQVDQELREALAREHGIRESLQEMDRVKTDFISSVSHELRTPLASILGYVEMLIDGSGGHLDDEQARVLGVIDRNAQRLLLLIEELLLVSTVESGTFRLSPGPVSLSSLINGAYQAVVPSLMSRDLQMSIDTAPDADAIVGDAGQLDRVMINLLTNAIKFTPDGGWIAVSTRAERDGVVIRVADSGIGIPIEDQARIFERFFRSPSAEHLAVPGTGLGLSITKAIIEEHGGSIAVASHPGDGTQVTVTLPFHFPGQLCPDDTNGTYR
jgi:PAS domain S-box-containing protein